LDRRTFVLHSSRAAAALAVLGPQGACQTLAVGGATPGSDSPFARLRDDYFVHVLRFNPVTSTYLGGDGYSAELADSNARLRDYRPAALASEAAYYAQAKAALDAMDPRGLPEVERVDHAVMGAQLAFILHQLNDLRYYQRAVDTYVAEPFRGVDWQIQGMTDLGGGQLGTEQEWSQVAQRVQAIPAYLEAAKANLLAGKAAGSQPDWRVVERDGIAGSRSNADYFRATLPDLAKQYAGSRPFFDALQARLAQAGAAAAAAWNGFAAFLGSTYDTSAKTDRFAIGAQEYEWRVRNNYRDTRSAAELWEYGQQQVDLYKQRMYEVAQAVAREANLNLPFDTDAEKDAGVRAVMDHLSGEFPKDDDELLRWYVQAGERAVAYGREHNLFDVPADYRLDVVPTPPVLRSTIDAAYYPAPPFKKSGVGRFYLTPTGNDPAALKVNNRSSVADTAVHEGFPGHDWNYKFMTQHAREISNVRWLTPGAVEDSSSMWEDSLATEGWGLYAEELMSEPAPGRPHGFYTAGEHLYELQGQMLRAVRVRVDVGLHTGRMTFDQAVDYFNANVDFYPHACARASADPTAKALCEGAQRAIYRYSKWPTQAIAYNLGKNAIISLREAYRAARGAAYSAKEFHERFMRQGPIPVGYFRTDFLAGARS
jgi:uncharacterized protein (DUF885 family)